MTDEHDVELGELSYLIDQIARHHAHRDAGAVHVTVFETAQRRRDHLVPHSAQFVGDAVPHPAAYPSAVHQYDLH